MANAGTQENPLKDNHLRHSVLSPSLNTDTGSRKLSYRQLPYEERKIFLAKLAIEHGVWIRMSTDGPDGVPTADILSPVPPLVIHKIAEAFPPPIDKHGVHYLRGDVPSWSKHGRLYNEAMSIEEFTMSAMCAPDNAFWYDRGQRLDDLIYLAECYGRFFRWKDGKVYPATTAARDAALRRADARKDDPVLEELFRIKRLQGRNEVSSGRRSRLRLLLPALQPQYQPRKETEV